MFLPPVVGQEIRLDYQLKLENNLGLSPPRRLRL
jgi:hypothetical protein